MTKTFGSFRQIYRTALRVLTIVLVLWIALTVVVQGYVINMPNLYR